MKAEGERLRGTNKNVRRHSTATVMERSWRVLMLFRQVYRTAPLHHCRGTVPALRAWPYSHTKTASVLQLGLLFVLLSITPQAQTPAQFGKITGRVLNEEGQPLGNIVVRAYVAGISRGGPPRNATTDDEGNFVFDQLPRATYRLEASGREYVLPTDPNRLLRIGDTATLTLVKGGVITGKVTDAVGEPVPAMDVAAIRIRDTEGQPLATLLEYANVRPSDDRGIYRIYGLPAGTYVVAANARSAFFTPPSSYENEAPTYYPSATRETATELTIRAGEETGGIDIRYRADVGRVVSGWLRGAVTGSDGTLSVQLKHWPSGAQFGVAYVRENQLSKGFALYGVLDGEYEIIGRRHGETDAGVTSKALRVTVRGADVTGLELLLTPLSSLAGRVTLEKLSAADAAKCGKPRAFTPEELLIAARRDERGWKAEPVSLAFRLLPAYETAADDKGEFALRGLEAGRYRFALRWPSADWYFKSVTQPALSVAGKRPPTAPLDAAPNGVMLKASENLTGLTLALAEGATSLQGKVVGKKLPARLRVHLIPSEADELLRYAESSVRNDGAFAFANLAPGKYWLLARALSEEEALEQRPLAWDAAERAKLRREAEAAKQEIELTVCQHSKDIVVQWSK